MFLWTWSLHFSLPLVLKWIVPSYWLSASRQEEKCPLLVSVPCQAQWIAVGIDDWWPSWLLKQKVSYHFDYGPGRQETTRFFSSRVPWLSIPSIVLMVTGRSNKDHCPGDLGTEQSALKFMISCRWQCGWREGRMENAGEKPWLRGSDRLEAESRGKKRTVQNTWAGGTGNIGG